ncbi:hypothetical protein EG329_013582 [Mollisiaceae sp. DMI_Dod_QoI]|nr:hypothetical protein EG329_013582 [Helotiales sp. DMI_Dod_QoI]
MQFVSQNIIGGLVFAFAVSVTMALPLPITRDASNLRHTIESFAKIYADQVEKEYSTVPNMLGDGKAAIAGEDVVAIALEDLEKRTLGVVPDDTQSITDYVAENVKGLSSANKIYNDRSSKTASTTLWKPFSNSRGRWTSSFKIGLTKLTGCITVVMVSNRGVYATHFFEDTAMEVGSKTYAAELLDSGSGNTFESIKSHFSDLNSSPAGPDYPFP